MITILLLEILIILLLIVANGILAMSEIAIVSSRKARLQHLSEQGNRKAEMALKLANDPDEFLSTIQIGITLVGILAGAVGGASVAEHFSQYLSNLGWTEACERLNESPF